MDSDVGYDVELWRQMAGELGLHGLGLPEIYGGSGYGPAETIIVFEELGRALVPSPFFATVALGAELLLAIGDAQPNRRYLPAIASGDLLATVAVAERAGSWDPRDLSEVVAAPYESAWRLHGEKTMVLNADSAGLILVVVTADDGTSVYAVDPATPGVTIVTLSVLDLTRRQSKVRFDGAAAILVGGQGTSARAVGSMLNHAAIALSAEQAGAAAELLRSSVEYAKLRQQFGRPIGSFQAVKHKLADMAFDVERMDSIVRHAASAADEGSSNLSVISAMAKVFCSEAFFRIAAETIQIHGGIGFTWEHPAHLYFRRAKSSEYLLGGPGLHREKLLEALGV
jgi:alkylation response protein AidB-like acyl-CoA dehydrogenase